MRTVWGYDVSANSLDPIISVADFNTATGSAFATNPRLESAIKAASQAIRNYCGWHICPSLSCTAYLTGGAFVVRLPACYVSSVTSVTENGTELDSGEFDWRRDGLLKRANIPWSDKWDGIEAVYTAGYGVDAVPDLVDAVCNIVVGILTVAPGVMSESADGVSISYSASASSVAAALTSAQKSALSPYKVVNSYAA